MRGFLTALLAVCALTGPVAAVTEAGPGLWRYDLADGKLTRLGDGTSVDWSPALQRVVYLQKTGRTSCRLCTMKADGTGRQVLVAKVTPNCWWARASADGRFLATVGLDFSQSDRQDFPTWPALLTVYGADGSHVRGPEPIARWEFEQYQPVGDVISWSPAGHQLAITPNLPDQRVPYLLDVETGRRLKFTGLPDAQQRQTWSVKGRTFLIQDLWQPTFSGDGRWLAFAGRPGVVAVAADGSHQRHLLADTPAELAGVPASNHFVLSPMARGMVRRVDLDGWSVHSWEWTHDAMGRAAASSTRTCWLGRAPKDGQGELVTGLWLGDADGQVKRCVRLAHLGELDLQLAEPPVWRDDGQAFFFEATPDS